LVLFWTAQCDV